MSDPVSGTTVAAGGLMGASVFGIATGIDYGVVFGAFAGAVFYVATAANISRMKLVGYFVTSFIVGVLGAGLVGSYLAKWTGYSDRPLDALGAVAVAALAIKLLTFINSQDLGSLFSMLSRLRGGGTSNGNKCSFSDDQCGYLRGHCNCSDVLPTWRCQTSPDSFSSRLFHGAGLCQHPVPLSVRPLPGITLAGGHR